MWHWSIDWWNCYGEDFNTSSATGWETYTEALVVLVSTLYLLIEKLQEEQGAVAIGNIGVFYKTHEDRGFAPTGFGGNGR